MFGLVQIALLFAVLVAVVELPDEFKLLSVAIAAVEAFVVFPWWFSVIHLFAVLTNEEADAEIKRMIERSMTIKRISDEARGGGNNHQERTYDDALLCKALALPFLPSRGIKTRQF